MKRWRALFCAVLLCGLCWTGLSMPVSAADNDYWLYNGVELPPLPEWDKTAYPYAFIFHSPSETSLWIIQSTAYTTSNGSRCIVLSPNKAAGYFLADGEWNYQGAVTYQIYVSFKYVIWANFNVLNANDSIYLAASDPVDPNAPKPITGRMVFGSEQVLDDFASFVLQIGDLSDTTASFSYGYKLYSGGEELRSVMDDESLTGSDGYIIHSTLLNLDPETEYEIIYTLYANGEPTEITASTTFTTLASSGSGGGSDPDYSGQLNSIQQGIGEIQDSVDDVGSKVDGIQDTLTETKEEITSLPGKIASAILDGIKSLFVPSEEDLTEIKDKYENMLSEKLGFVWQAFDLLTTFVGDLQTSLESGEAYEFNFPGVKLPMQGEEFVLVPETAVSLDNGLMDVLRPVLGTVISMIAVIAFVNMAHDYVLAIVSGVSAYQFERRKE